MKEKGFDYLKGITAVDHGDSLEVIYFLYNTSSKSLELLVVKLPTGLQPQPLPGIPIAPQKLPATGPNAQTTPKVSTITHIYPAADWYERELSEMFGIKIEGRKAPRLLLEKWNGAAAPLRKSFAWGKPYQKIGE